MSNLPFHTHRDILFVFVISLMLLFSVALSQFRLWQQPDSLSLPELPTAMTQHTQTPAQLIDATLQLQLFGASPYAANGNAVAPKLTLIGIFMSPNPDQRSVVVKDAQGNELLLTQHQRLPSGWQVVDVQSNFVILSNGSARTKYPLITPSSDAALPLTAQPNFNSEIQRRFRGR